MQVAAHDGVADLDTDVLNLAQTAQYAAGSSFGRMILLLKDLGGITCGSGIEEKNVVFQGVEEFARQAQPCGAHISALRHFQLGQAAECSHILVLLADGLSQPPEFDLTGFLSQYVRSTW